MLLDINIITMQNTLVIFIIVSFNFAPTLIQFSADLYLCFKLLLTVSACGVLTKGKDDVMHVVSDCLFTFLVLLISYLFLVEYNYYRPFQVLFYKTLAPSVSPQ